MTYYCLDKWSDFATIKDKAQFMGVLPSWVMCDRSVMILESFFLLLGGAGVPDRGMLPDWENRDQRI